MRMIFCYTMQFTLLRTTQHYKKDLDALNSWSTDNYLKFNPAECKYMRKGGDRVPQHTLCLMGEPIECVKSFRYLGITLAEDLYNMEQAYRRVWFLSAARLLSAPGPHFLPVFSIGLNRPESGGTVPISVTTSRRPALQ